MTIIKLIKYFDENYLYVSYLKVPSLFLAFSVRMAQLSRREKGLKSEKSHSGNIVVPQLQAMYEGRLVKVETTSSALCSLCQHANTAAGS